MAGRPNKIPYRWTAQDGLGMGASPPALANPYGVNPGELYVATGKSPPDDKRWAKDLLDGDVIELPLRICRIPSLLDPFFVAGYTWETAPPEVEASTIGELCQKLAGLGERYAIYGDFADGAPAPRTAEERRTLGDRKRAIAKKLLEYWDNTDYRWAILHSGRSLTTIAEQPESLPLREKGKASVGGKDIEVDGKLTYVLARATPTPAVRVKPHRDGGGTPRAPDPTTIRLPTKPSWNLDPSDTDPLKDLDPVLRETLKRSFLDRMVAVRGAHLNLDNAFWSSPPPDTTWDAVRRFSAMGVNLLVHLFTRLKEADTTMGLWKQVRYVRNLWWGGSAGVKVVYYDPAAARVYLDSLLSGANGRPVARDAYIGGLEHQLAPSYTLVFGALADGVELPDCDTWREVDKPKEEGFHVCIGKSDLPGHTAGTEFFEVGPTTVSPTRPVNQDDIHIDWFCPVSGIDPVTHKCTYLDVFSGSAEHWAQATLGIGAPIFTFHTIDRNADRIHGTSPEADDFLRRWEAAKWGLALRGRAGFEDSKPYYEELRAIFKKLTQGEPPPNG